MLLRDLLKSSTMLIGRHCKKMPWRRGIGGLIVPALHVANTSPHSSPDSYRLVNWWVLTYGYTTAPCIVAILTFHSSFAQATATEKASLEHAARVLPCQGYHGDNSSCRVVDPETPKHCTFECLFPENTASHAGGDVFVWTARISSHTFVDEYVVTKRASCLLERGRTLYADDGIPV